MLMTSIRAVLVLAFAAAALLVPATAVAAGTYSDTVTGVEYFATSTDGKFAGSASGSLAGTWNADVQHTALCITCTPTATITGGSFSLVTRLNGWPTVVSGSFSGVGGYVQVTSPGLGCTNQTFLVHGVLAGVHSLFGGNGSGSFDVQLTHYRTMLFGSCVTYGATVAGTLGLTF
jgi:hypothetical protein